LTYHEKLRTVTLQEFTPKSNAKLLW